MCGRRGSAGAGQSRPRARDCRNRLVFCSARDSAFAPGPAAKRSLQERTRAVRVFLPWISRKHPRFRHAISASGRLVYRWAAPASSGLSHFDRDGCISHVRKVKKRVILRHPPRRRKPAVEAKKLKNPVVATAASLAAAKAIYPESPLKTMFNETLPHIRAVDMEFKES